MSSIKEYHYFDKLTHDNYSVWKFKVEQLLIKEGLYDVVFEPKKENDDNWVKNDRNARALICLNISDSQIVHVKMQEHIKSVLELAEKLRSIGEVIQDDNLI